MLLRRVVHAMIRIGSVVHDPFKSISLHTDGMRDKKLTSKAIQGKVSIYGVDKTLIKIQVPYILVFKFLN